MIESGDESERTEKIDEARRLLGSALRISWSVLADAPVGEKNHALARVIEASSRAGLGAAAIILGGSVEGALAPVFERLVGDLENLRSFAEGAGYKNINSGGEDL